MAALRSALAAAALATTVLPAAGVKWRDLPMDRKTTYTFDHFVTEFQRNYAADEIDMRRNLFRSSLADVLAHNAGNHTWIAGINKFSDRTEAEFKQYKGKMLTSSYVDGDRRWFTPDVKPNGTVPDSIDWRTHGAVTPVKNQGGCGSCWAFSATETVESAVFLATGKLPTLAPQELVDCVTNPDSCGGTGGCQGATQELGYAYAMLNGMTPEASYPYKGQNGNCMMGSAGVQPTVGIKGYVKLPSNDNEALKAAVGTMGPVAISVDASWGGYESGVFSGCSARGNTATIDHGVQAVGYGVDATGGPYWLVRNSWGPDWGDGGYIKIKRATGTAPCYTDPNNQSGDGCKDSPKSITVCGECGILSDSSIPTGAFAMTSSK